MRIGIRMEDGESANLLFGVDLGSFDIHEVYHLNIHIKLLTK